jgi:hypothetical protein
MAEEISGNLKIPAGCGRNVACVTAVPWIKGHGFRSTNEATSQHHTRPVIMLILIILQL